ncbi:FtsX-like permease family protein [Novosphingobium umbonatum]|uniref:FtsX-like permease family protein n=1 Tax=Novosphingobium umbonatum TaxID=1908524 RepID=A0A3S2YB11_9SPHN|nr:FtsX-like permease family protein [Novosphingobium umbonatum]RVU07554.1 FtsX-like permease family protein [Novosphingobium umbonatum]
MSLSWSAAWRIARRELSARFKGLRLLLACLFLGVGALAAIGSLTTAISQGLAAKGRTILGGDVQITVWQRPFTVEERKALSAYGTLSDGQRMQAMASHADNAAPVQLKAVDAAWPLVGRLTLSDGRQVGAPPQGSAWIASGAAARLGLKAGDQFTIAGQPLRVGGIIATEPDGLGEGFALGPTVIVPMGFPDAAGLTATGAMFRSRLRMACAATCNPQAIADALTARFPEAGLDIRTRDKATPGTESFITRMGDFLVLLGLAALLIAGLGIGGGTASYLEARRGVIATLKVLGATSGDIARIYVLQILAAAGVGALAGLAAGVAILPLLARLLADVLPVMDGPVLAPWALSRAALWGLLVALVFAAPPLAAARHFPAMALLRARVSPVGGWRRGASLPVLGGVAAIVGLAFLGGGDSKTTAIFLGGAGAAFGLLGGLGWLVRWVAAHMPRPRGVIARQALANLHRPGAQTGRLVTALGFGLTAFVLLAVVQTSLDANIAARVPQKAPDYFVIDLQPQDEPALRSIVEQSAKGASVRSVPTLRGAILSYGPEGQQTRVSDMKDIPQDAWQLKGERGLTFADDIPEGNVITQGAWWPKGYSGEPLVSIDDKLASATGLKVGDRITVGLLGVERSARIASLRRIDWQSFGFNYVLVFSPNALTGAPFKLAATVNLPPFTPTKGAKANDGLLRALTKSFPTASVVEVGPLLRDARGLLTQLANAILAAASVAVLAGIAVLLGALAAARASRAYDNTILRVLGASQRQLLGLLLAEYGALALLLALVALALGSGLGWLVVVQLFSFDFMPDWGRVLMVLGAGLALVMAFALGGSLPVLRTRPAAALREL